MGHRMAPGHQAYCVLWRYSSGVCPVCFLKARVRTSGPKAAGFLRETAPLGRAARLTPRSPERERWVCGWRPWAWYGAGWGGGQIPRDCDWGFLTGGTPHG